MNFGSYLILVISSYNKLLAFQGIDNEFCSFIEKGEKDKKVFVNIATNVFSVLVLGI